MPQRRWNVQAANKGRFVLYIYRALGTQSKQLDGQGTFEGLLRWL